MVDYAQMHHNYDDRLERLKDKYDVVIVGAGIYGAALFWEATSRGLSVLLVEQNDFGSATSQNSLKIIHSGIRYLQSLNFKRVIESIQESKNLVRLAPYLVKPLECVAILDGMSSLEKTKIRLGTFLYNLLSLQRNRGLPSSKHFGYARLLSADTLQKKCESISIRSSQAGLNWYDGQVTNTERMIMAFIMSAIQKNADAINYVKCENHIQDKQNIRAVSLYDCFGKQQREIQTDAIFYCVGPWLKHNKSFADIFTAHASTKLARAVNIVVNRNPEKFALGLQQPSEKNKNNRFLFITPFQHKMIIGTWYFDEVDSEQGQLTLGEDEIQIIIDEVNNVLPQANISLQDINLIHYGELPISKNNNLSLDEALLEKNNIYAAHRSTGPKYLYFVQGVKYTAARSAAVKAVDQLKAELPNSKIHKSSTHLTPLYGGDMSDHEKIFYQLRQKYHLEEVVLHRLVTNYGTISKDILCKASNNTQLYELVPGTTDVIKVEINYLIEQEMALTVSDLIQRRLGTASVQAPNIKTIEYCASILQKYYGVDSNTINAQINECVKDYPF